MGWLNDAVWGVWLAVCGFVAVLRVCGFALSLACVYGFTFVLVVRGWVFAGLCGLSGLLCCGFWRFAVESALVWGWYNIDVRVLDAGV